MALRDSLIEFAKGNRAAGFHSNFPDMYFPHLFNDTFDKVGFAYRDTARFNYLFSLKTGNARNNRSSDVLKK